MLEALKRFLSPEYLVVADPGPMGRLTIVYFVLGFLFAAGLGLAVWVLRDKNADACGGVRRAWAWFELWICLAGLATVIGRFLGWPGWSARIWPLTLAILAFASAMAIRFAAKRLPRWLADLLRTLALVPRAGTPEWGNGSWRERAAFCLGLAGHLLGISLVLRTRIGWPLLAAPLLLLAVLLPQAPLLLRRRVPKLTPLAPLLGGYAAALLWLLYQQLGITIIGWQGLIFPNPMVSLFYVDGILLAAVAYSILCQLSVVSTELGKRAILWRWAVAGLLALTLTWAAVVHLGKRTHGATASDPYAYAQMGVDLAEHGTFLHRLSLFEDVMPLEIAWAPLQPVGYHIPRNELGESPSVWATGASALLAAGYVLLGEEGLYVTTPIVGFLSLLATWALVQEVLRGKPKSVRYLTGALAVGLLATSPEHVDRLLVPMADAPAQLFTVLTLLLAIRGMHDLERERSGLLPFLLAGASFAWAYWVRHTQLVLLVPVVIAIILGSRERLKQAATRAPLKKGLARLGVEHPSRGVLFFTSALGPVLAFSVAALLVALPDIVYRWEVFDGLFATETTELPLMGLQHIGPVSLQMAREALMAAEWGYLFPMALYGSYRLARGKARETAVLASAFAAVLLVHLTYRSLRLRDLLSLFPVVDLAVAYGAVSLVRWARSICPTDLRKERLGAVLLPAIVVAWVLLSLALSRWAVMDRPWKPGWASFGYVDAQQRAAFDRLAELTPEEGIIGASLNAGAIMMYTGRDAIRPYDSWTEEEWSLFLSAMQARGRPIYLLDDGGDMALLIERERTRRTLVPIEALRIPIFFSRDRDTGWLYRLEWDQ